MLHIFKLKVESENGDNDTFMKKIKIFLGAYVNYPNAQNVNCDYIAKYLDKDKFEVHTMYTDKMPINKAFYESKGIHLHKLIHHRFIWWWSKYLTMRFGNYDIYYLPKMEPMDMEFAKRHPDKVLISSVEGVITEGTNNGIEFRDYQTRLMSSSFAISNCIADSVKKYWNIELPVLPLGVEERKSTHLFKSAIKNIIWVGNIKANKRPQLLLECAKRFPKLSFCMVGDGDMQDIIRLKCKAEEIVNIHMTGRIPNADVYEHMTNADLLLMTSEFEGLPKVIQEAAQCGVPAIYINENYTVDFINSGINGYAVPDVDQMIEKIQYLLEHPAEYQKMSKSAYGTIQAYTWKNLIKSYEEYFIKLYQDTRG